MARGSAPRICIPVLRASYVNVFAVSLTYCGGYVKQRGVSLTYSAPLLLEFYSLSLLLEFVGLSLRLLLESFVRLLRRRDDYVDVRQSIDEMLDEEAQVNPLQDTYDPTEGEGQSAEHDDAKGVHRSIEIKVAYQLGGAVFVSRLHSFFERVVLHVVE